MLNPREYQTEIIKRAAHSNTIAFLPTGAGKTLIACHLIGLRIASLRKASAKASRKWIVFVAPKRVLLSQQVDYLRKRCPQQIQVEDFSGSRFHGDLHIDRWTEKEWGVYFNKCEVLGMTPAVLERLITHDLLPPRYLDFVVLDECHNAISGNDPMGRLCDALFSKGDRPLIFGMTASPVKAKKANVVRDIALLEKRLKSTFYRPTEHSSLRSLEEHSSRPRLFSIEFSVRRFRKNTVVSNRFPLSSPDDEVIRGLATLRLRHVTHLRELLEAKNIAAGNVPAITEIIESLGLSGKSWKTSMLQPVSEVLSQVGSITDECGPLCGVLALNISMNNLISPMSDLQQHFKLSETAHMMKQSLQVSHEIDVSKLELKRNEIISGPFRFSLLVELLDQRLAVCKSLLELFISLLLSLGTEGCAFVAEQLYSRMELASQTAEDDGPNNAKQKKNDEVNMDVEEKGGPENSDEKLIEVEEVEEEEEEEVLNSPLDEEQHQIKNEADKPNSEGKEEEVVLKKLNVSNVGRSLVKLVRLFSENPGTEWIVASSTGGCVMVRKAGQPVWSCSILKATNSRIMVREVLRNLQLITAVMIETMPMTQVAEKFGLHRVSVQNDEGPSVDMETSCDRSNESVDLSAVTVSSVLLSKKTEALLSTWVRVNQQTSKEEQIENVKLCELRTNMFQTNSWFPIADEEFLQAAEVVRRAAEDNSAHLPTTIIFGKMQLSVLVLHSLFEKLFDSVAKKYKQTARVGCGRINGSDQPRYQQSVLSDLKQGKIQILFTTAVAEEGIDISSCNIVLNFNCPETVTSLIQRRGRARSKDSIMLFLVDVRSEEGQRNKRDVIRFSGQEEKMRNTTRSLLLSGTVEEEGEIDPSSIKEFSFQVPGTEVVIDALTAIQIFHRYCQTLTHDDFYRPTPLLVLTSFPNEAEGEPDLFSCSLLLPSEIPVKNRCMVSPLCSRKMIAKGAVLLQAVQALFEAGELDERLLRTGEELAATVLEKESENLPGEGSRIPVNLKETPSCLAPPGVNDTERAQLFFFSVSIKNQAETCWSDICPLMDSYMKYKLGAIEDLCLVLPHPVPSPGLECAFKCLLFDDVTVELNFNCIDSAMVCKDEIIEMQRLHRSLMGIDLLRPDPQNFLIPRFGDTLAPLDSSPAAEDSSFWSSEKWSELCGGMWILTVPMSCLDNAFHSIEQPEEISETRAPKRRKGGLSIDLSKLKAAADEAQILMHNFTLHRTGRLNFPSLLPAQPLPSYKDVIVSTASTNMMCAVLDENDHTGLDSVLKEVTKKADPNSMDVEDSAAPVEKIKLTFGMYLSEKYPELAGLVEQYSKDDSTKRMNPAFSVGKRDQSSGYESLTLISSESTRSKKKVYALKAKQRVHFQPNLALVLGKAHWLFMGQVMHSLVRILNSACLACEATRVVASLVEERRKEASQAPEATADGTQVTHLITDEGSVDLDKICPDAMLMLEALSPKIADSHFNSERLEMLGDTFLKYAVTIELFNLYPQKNESFLSVARSRIICNDNLCRLAQISGLLPYIRMRKDIPQEEDQQSPEKGDKKGKEETPKKVENNENMCENSTTQLTTKGSVEKRVRDDVSWKRAADLIESLLGAYYLAGGVNHCCHLMKCLGLWPARLPAEVPEEEKVQKVQVDQPMEVDSSSPTQAIITQQEHFATTIPDNFDPILKNIALGFSNQEETDDVEQGEQIDSSILKLFSTDKLSAVAAMEGIFGYKFRDEGLLNEALTHGSVPHSRSNQRLEFLGDAVLDFVVVSFFFCADNSLREGDLSVTKSSLTCNENLAAIAIKLGLYRHLVHYSLSLQEVFSSFAQQEEMDEEREEELQDKKVSTSKVLADLFEAIVGAIFLDSHHDIPVLTLIMKKIGLLPMDAAPGSKISQYALQNTELMNNLQ